MATYIFTGRFQPLHKAHISLLEEFRKKHPNDLLLICIIRQSINDCDQLLRNEFALVSKSKQKPINNPIPNWERYELLHLAIRNDDILKDNTEIIFRDRSDIDWESSVRDLPTDRIWILPNYQKEKFDVEKYNYYKSKNEIIELVDVPISNQTSASNIRDNLRSGIDDFSFLPSVCVDYFKKYCLKYFI